MLVTFAAYCPPGTNPRRVVAPPTAANRGVYVHNPRRPQWAGVRADLGNGPADHVAHDGVVQAELRAGRGEERGQRARPAEGQGPLCRPATAPRRIVQRIEPDAQGRQQARYRIRHNKTARVKTCGYCQPVARRSSPRPIDVGPEAGFQLAPLGAPRAAASVVVV